MNEHHYVGIDYSMSSPGIVTHPDLPTFSYKNCQFYFLGTQTPKPDPLAPKIVPELYKDYKSPEERFSNLAYWVLGIIGKPIRVSLEGYSYSSVGKIFEIGENTGLLKHALWRNGTPFSIVAPTTLKKFATGSGKATKDQMLDQFVKETGFDLLKNLTPKRKASGSPVSDLVDAYFLAKHAFQAKDD